MGDEILTIKNLKKYFKEEKKSLFAKNEYLKAVDDVSFSIKSGETLGLVGESGCGKSTLSKVLMRLKPADGGEVIFMDKDILKLKGKELRKSRIQMQMIFQNPFGSLNPRMTIGEIIEAPMVINKTAPKNERVTRVKELMSLVGLNTQYMNRYPHEFSGGQRQRIGIARALALNPKLIICDEPVSALDVSIQSQILNLLKDLQDKLGLTFLFISHNLSVVKYVSNRIAVMYLGKIVELADSEALYESPKHPYTQALMSAIPDIDKENKKERIILTGDVPNAVNPPSGCRFRTRCRFAKPICSQVEPQLSDTGNGHSVACHLYTAKEEAKADQAC